MEHAPDAARTSPRTRVRPRPRPLLGERTPGAGEHLCAAAARLREDEAELSRQAERISGQGLDIPEGLAGDVEPPRGGPPPLAPRARGQLLGKAGASRGTRPPGGGPGSFTHLPAPRNKAKTRSRLLF